MGPSRPITGIALLFLPFNVNVGIEVLIVVAMKSYVLWDITPDITDKVNRRFGGIYCLHLQGEIISHARNHYEGE
jgi:hypothetical protein